MLESKRTTKAEALKGIQVDFSRKIANNTYEYSENGIRKIRLHQTTIITFNANGSISLNSGGWRTKPTKARICEFSKIRISQESGVWHIHTSQGKFAFADGITIFPDGKVTGQGDAKQSLILQKKIKVYVASFVSELLAGKIPLPSSGDCWGCCMKDKEGKTAFGNSHLLEHIKEKYYVPSLLFNAVENEGILIKSAIYRICNGETISDYEKPLVNSYASKALSRYLKINLAIGR